MEVLAAWACSIGVAGARVPSTGCPLYVLCPSPRRDDPYGGSTEENSEEGEGQEEPIPPLPGTFPIGAHL